MTLILGIESKAGALVASDSFVGNSETCNQWAADYPKIWRAGAYIIAQSGSTRVMDIVRWMKWPEPPKTNVHRFLVAHAIPALRKALTDGGAMEHNTANTRTGADEACFTLVLAVRGRIYDIDMDFAVNRYASGYVTGGSGHAVATGALYAARAAKGNDGSEVMSRWHARRALDAAAAHVATVRGPFKMFWQPRP
jgi:hypothetical protein